MIEHLSNPGLFLEGCRNIMSEDSILIITTPNVFAMQYVWTNLIDGKEFNADDHTHFHSMRTLEQLLAKHRYAVIEKHYAQNITTFGIRPILRRLIGRVAPHIIAPKIIIIACDEKNDRKS